MEYVIYLFSGIIILSSLILLRKRDYNKSRMHQFSILIACRNEYEQLPALFSALDKLNYPKNLYEVIIVDDASTDSSWELIKSWSQNKINVKSLFLTEKDSTYKGKKAALKLASEQANFEIFLFTDADCQPHPNWLESMNRYIADDTGMVIGNYYEINAPALRAFSDKLTAAFFGISTNLGLPYSCSGMNMLIRKSTFSEVGGYEKIKHHLAGDDKLMLNLIRKTNWKINYNPEKIMASTSENDPHSNHQQRLRKYGKFGSSRFIIKLISIIIGLFYLALPIYLIQNGITTAILSLIFSLLLFWCLNSSVHKGLFSVKEFLILLFFPYFLIYYSIAGLIIKWEWKGQQK